MSSAQPVTVGSVGGPTVAAANQSDHSAIDLDRWARVAAETLVAEQVTRGHLDLTFVDPAEMAELNVTHMGQDGPTDVLSFPLDGEEEANTASGVDATDPDPPPILLGDVVICPRVAQRQAPDHCGDLDTELTLLIVHGVLHVLGHDHAETDEAIVMVGREQEHLDRYAMIHPGPVPPGSTGS